jgi:hypothetical protein
MSYDKQFFKDSEIILMALDGQLNDDQFAEFDKRLQKDSSFRQYYLRFLALNTSLGAIDKFPVVRAEIEDSPFLNQNFWLELAEYERTAPTIEIPKEKPKREPAKMLQIETPKRKVSKFSIYTLALSAAAVLLLVAMVLFTPVHPVVATLTDSVNAEWGDIPVPANGDILRQGEFTLVKGFAEVTFKTGAKVILQAPIEFGLESVNSIFLDTGRLSSIVPESATGFTVRTAGAIVVDYGTKFGVVSYQDGETGVHVFSGEVGMRIPNADKSRPAKRLRGGQRCVVADGEIEISRLPDSSKSFVRDMNEILSEGGYLGRNLVVNGDFEANRDVPQVDNKDFDHLSHNLRIAGWQDETLATVVPYNDFNGRHFNNQRADDIPVPPDHGMFFFCGIEHEIVWQEISVAGLANRINAGDVRFDLLAWFGGWSDHRDNAVITVHFLDWTDFEVGTAKLGPLTVEDRNSQLMFSERTAAGRVPAETHIIRLEIETFMGFGSSDAYVDNISLILNTK